MKSYRKETNLSEDRIDELQKQYYYSNQVCGEVLNQQLDEGPIMLKGKDTLENRNQLRRNTRAKRNIYTENFACLGKHSMALKKQLVEISCKIDELQELMEQNENKQCRHVAFVSCCFIAYMICFLVLPFGPSRLY